MEKRYDCELTTTGFRLSVVVFAQNRSDAHSKALERAIELMEQVYKLEKFTNDFKVNDIKER